MISHHHECIFVHITKAGGQSIETAFLEDLGLDWDTRAPLLLRPNDRSELGPPRLAHLTAAEYVSCRYVPEEMFRRYYKFSVVRNPWSRAVSLYRYVNYRGSFRRFLRAVRARRVRPWAVRPQIEFLEIDGAIAVDDVLQLENLSQEFERVRARLGLRSELRRVNVTSDRKGLFGWGRERHPHWRDYYDDETREAVARFYAKDIAAFGYTFDGQGSSAGPTCADAGDSVMGGHSEAAPAGRVKG